MRQGINDILRGSEGALIVIGEPAELSFLFSGGIRLDQAFSPYLLYELAKMDGAIILNSNATRIVYANVQLMPDPTIPSAETGTRHRTAERVAKQTGALAVSISQQRDVVTLYVGDSRYQLEEIPAVLAKTNQALTTLDTYRTRLEQVSTRLTALEFQSAVMLDDVLTALQRAEMTTRMVDEIERNVAELGVEGRLIKIQLDEMTEWVPADKLALIRDYEVFEATGGAGRVLAAPGGAARRRAARVRRAGGRCWATRARSTRWTTRWRRAATACCRRSRGCRTHVVDHVVGALQRPGGVRAGVDRGAGGGRRASAACGRVRSARVCGGCRSRTWSTATSTCRSSSAPAGGVPGDPHAVAAARRAPAPAGVGATGRRAGSRGASHTRSRAPASPVEQLDRRPGDQPASTCAPESPLVLSHIRRRPSTGQFSCGATAAAALAGVEVVDGAGRRAARP